MRILLKTGFREQSRFQLQKAVKHVNSQYYSTYTSGPDQVLPATSYVTSNPDGAVKILMKDSGNASAKPISVYSSFKSSVEKFSLQKAMAVKTNGDWRYWTYEEYFNESVLVAKALISLGLNRFNGVCISGFNSPQWFISYMGTIFAGGLSAGVYTTNSVSACQDLVRNSHAQIALVENGELARKFLAVQKNSPLLKVIVQWDGQPTPPGVLSWQQLLEIGREESDACLNQRLSLQAVNQCCTLIYTSGTTGSPKGVMCSQDQLTWVAQRYCDLMEVRSDQESIVSYLPLSHIAGLMTDLYWPITLGGTTYFAGPDALKGTLGDVLKEVRPTVFLTVPRVWEKIYEKIQQTSAQSSVLKKRVAKWAKYHGLNHWTAYREGRSLSYSQEFQYYLAKQLVHNKIKKALGLERCAYTVSISAPIATDMLDYFMSLDLPISEAYGLSESAAVGTHSYIKPFSFKSGSIGKAAFEEEVFLKNIGDAREGEGEICIRGRSIGMGYLRMPKQTSETFSECGGLMTGDIGRMDEDGFIYLTGRLKELLITAGGENVPPVLIEDIVKRELPCISNCMLIGDNRRYLTILLTLKCEMDPDTGEPLEQLQPITIKWLSRLGCSAKTVTQAVEEIKRNPSGKIASAIDEGINRYNEQAISNAQRIQRWRVLPQDFSLPTGELNNTLKLKRPYVLEKYADLIEDMYPPAQ